MLFSGDDAPVALCIRTRSKLYRLSLTWQRHSVGERSLVETEEKEEEEEEEEEEEAEEMAEEEEEEQ